MEEKYERPDIKVVLARLRTAVLVVSGGDDDPDIPPMPDGD